MEPYEKLQRYWTESNAPVQSCTHSEAAVAALETKYDIRIPKDFRAYLLNCCPERECDMDEALFGWWGLDRIRNIPDEYPHDLKNPLIVANSGKYLFFADYCMWCWAWAIACGDDENRGRIVVIGGDDTFISNSFAEFVDSLIADPKHYLGI
jgi:hypothetical protein